MPDPAGGVQSVDRALALLELLSRAGGRLSLSELATRSGLSPATVHRLLRSLAARGYVRQGDDRVYALGTALLPLGDVAGRLLSNWARPYLAEVAEASGETTNLAVLEDDYVVYLAQVPGRYRMRMFTEVGRRVLPHSTAVGKVLLAWRDAADVDRVVARFGLPSRTERTLTSPQRFAQELAGVRDKGWAMDDEEEEAGVRCLAVPVGPGPACLAALSVSGPAVRLAAAPELIDSMRAVASRLAASLVHR